MADRQPYRASGNGGKRSPRTDRSRNNPPRNAPYEAPRNNGQYSAPQGNGQYEEPRQDFQYDQQYAPQYDQQYDSQYDQQYDPQYDQYDDGYGDGYYEDEYVPMYDDDLSRKRANRGCLIAFLAVVAAIVIIALVLVFNIKKEIDGGNATGTEPVTVTVESSGANAIGTMLQENGLISNSTVFRFYVRFSGSGVDFQAGKHELTPGMSYDEIIAVLSEKQAARKSVKVTIPEGSTIYQFGSKLEKAGVCTKKQFVKAANKIAKEEIAKGDASSYEFFKHIELDPNTWKAAEGYLAANTFDFFIDEENGAEYAAQKLFEQMNADIASLSDNLYAELEQKGISLRDLISMASLIEEECSVAGLSAEELYAEQQRVSAVFWNRMQGDLTGTGLARHTMGSDVTYRYLEDWVSRDYNNSVDQLTAENPDLFYAYYTGDDDTQTREGLMAGPISSPSASALRAAFNPDPSYLGAYYFFVTDLYGNYFYAYDYWTHTGNVAQADANNARYLAENPEETEG